MAIVSQAARDTRISLTSLALGDLQPKVQEGIKYQTLPLTLGLQGPVDDIGRFLFLLGQRTPAVAVTNIRLTNVEVRPTAQVQLLFYLSPEPAPGKTPQPSPRKG